MNDTTEQDERIRENLALYRASAPYEYTSEEYEAIFEGRDPSEFAEECAPKMLTEWEAMGLYDDMLDECCESYNLNGMEYMPSTILKECDPIAYRVGFADYADSLAQEGMPVEGYI
jgi:hypothetical protein